MFGEFALIGSVAFQLAVAAVRLILKPLVAILQSANYVSSFLLTYEAGKSIEFLRSQFTASLPKAEEILDHVSQSHVDNRRSKNIDNLYDNSGVEIFVRRYIGTELLFS
jgi:hypothetical protein